MVGLSELPLKGIFKGDHYALNRRGLGYQNKLSLDRHIINNALSKTTSLIGPCKILIKLEQLGVYPLGA